MNDVKKNLKRNLKSIRLSDDIVELVESFDGENFSQKIANMIFMCKKELPIRQKQLDTLEDLIEKRAAQLEFIEGKIDQVDNILCDVLCLQPTLNKIRAEVQDILLDM